MPMGTVRAKKMPQDASVSPKGMFYGVRTTWSGSRSGGVERGGSTNGDDGSVLNSKKGTVLHSLKVPSYRSRLEEKSETQHQIGKQFAGA